MATEFQTFVDHLFSRLGKDDFYDNNSLTDYFQRPRTERSGDEANIVDDKITSVLIEALGYSSGEISYQTGSGRKKTDFMVRISQYPRPCFVAESKNTATSDVSIHLPQLADYMRSETANRGLLIDGKLILTYELNAGQIILTGKVHLLELIEKWRGESLLTSGQNGVNSFNRQDKVILRAFWQRFNRIAFAGQKTLIDELTLKTDGKPHLRDGSSWRTESQINIIKPNDESFISTLTDESAQLIEEVALDVQSQLFLRLQEYKKYEEELSFIPNSDLTFDKEFDRLWNEFFASAQAWSITESRRNSYYSQIKISFDTARTGSILENLKRDIDDDIRAINENLSSKQKRSEKQIKKAVNDFYKIINEFSVLRKNYLSRRERLQIKYQNAIETNTAFTNWEQKVATILLRTDDTEKLLREFSAQTAYVLYVRLLLVRILEDKDLIPRIFTNGGIALWFEQVEPQYLKYAEGRSTDFLLEMAYESAQHIYAHYYSENLVFDWYKADRNMVIRLLHRLAGFDFIEIDRDIIGHIYGGYLKSEHKHESGMYYTPIKVVEYILDRLDYQGKNIVGKTILDPSCGSGAFLVSACRRQLESYFEYYQNEGKTKQDLSADEIRTILQAISQNIYGLELNPFACYLAETNLLIQVLDLLKLARQKNAQIRLNKFHIYNTDTLRYETDTLMILNSSIGFSADELSIGEQIKGRLLDNGEGFDFVVGNPPYVRADEGADGLLEYRKEIKDHHPIDTVRNLLERRWDLFVPFVALGVHLLRNETGRLGMITSNSIELVNYAALLRQMLSAKTKVDEVNFFPKFKIFEDAAVENTIFVLTNSSPDNKSKTLRYWHEETLGRIIKEEKLEQIKFGENIFRQTNITESYKDTTELKTICYISFAMRLNSSDNSELSFTKDDLLSYVKDEIHQVTYIEGENISPYELTGVRFLEHGEGLRSPDEIYRQTFPELYDRRKIMRGETSAGWLDDGKTIDNGWMYCNHSVILFMPWKLLNGVENRSILGELRSQEFKREKLENTSVKFTIEYILAIMNSPKATEILEATTVSARRSRFQPNDFRELPIPIASKKEQKEITKKVNSLLKLGTEFLELRREGWIIKTADNKVISSAQLKDFPTIRSNPLGVAKVAWGMRILDKTAHPATLWQKSEYFFRKKTKVVEFSQPISRNALDWMQRQFKTLPSDMSFQSVETQSVKFPATPTDAEQALELLIKREEKVIKKTKRFNRLNDEINVLVNKLYEDRIV